MNQPTRLAAVVLAVLALGLAACGDDDSEPVAATTTAPATLECDTVGFTPNSEDAASDVTASGLSCDEAEAFVEKAGRQTSAGGPDEVDVEGYHCVRTGSEQEPLPRSTYECTSGSKTVTFTRS